MKPLFIISCPLDTFSGYGARSRDIVLSIIKSGKYDVKVLSQRWGNTPFGFLQANNPDHKLMLDAILKTGLPKQPDIWMQITVPNEFQPVGKYNIGVTAGIETTLCAAPWIEGLNRMNLNLVSSEHAKKVFEDSKFEKRNSQTQQVEGIIELKTPVEVLFEGADLNKYKIIDLPSDSEILEVLNDIPESFCYLFIGHWIKGDFREDRKDISGLIHTFLTTFKGQKVRPALILKTSSATSSIMDREEILVKIRAIEESVGGDLPSIYLLHGDLTDGEINELYNHPKVKSFVSFTKGEGFGRPLLEASLMQKPVIASGWSGHVDFLDKEMSILLPGQLKQIHPSAVVQDMLIPESQWFTVDYSKGSDALVDVYKNYKKYVDGAKRQSYRSRTEFSLEKMSEKLISILESKIPVQAQLKLPSLKKIELPKMKKAD
jgi:glycosyltransferase involved in cell wall biosynthesis